MIRIADLVDLGSQLDMSVLLSFRAHPVNRVDVPSERRFDVFHQLEDTLFAFRRKVACCIRLPESLTYVVYFGEGGACIACRYRAQSNEGLSFLTSSRLISWSRFFGSRRFTMSMADCARAVSIASAALASAVACSAGIPARTSSFCKWERYLFLISTDLASVCRQKSRPGRPNPP